VRKRILEPLLKELPLDNGIVLEVTDESSNYYADFWNLKVVIRGTAKVTPDHLRAINPSNPYEQESKEALGYEVLYHRELTRIGVREAEKEATIQKLLGSFEENSLPYLEHSFFPKKMARSRWKKLADEIKGKKREGNA
jgi:hypothetical protein